MGRPTSSIHLQPIYEELAQHFYTHLLQLGYKPHGCKNKWRRIKEFLYFAQSTISTDITAISTKDIITYYNYLKQRPSRTTGKPITEKTAVDTIYAIQEFYQLLQNKGQATYNPTNTIQLKSPPQESSSIPLTQEEIRQLYNHTITLQEKAILHLGYGCGLRVSEVMNCNIEDIKLRENTLIVTSGKGNKSRIVPMNKNITKDLGDYLVKERLQQTSSEARAFILHSRLGRMQTESYNQRLKKLINRTGNEQLKTKKITMHTLRHSIATHLIEQGVPLEQVREFLGHSELETTEIYTHVSIKQLQKLTQ